MKIEHSSIIKTNSFFYSITPKERFSDNLELSLFLRGNNTDGNFERGFIDLHYQLIDNKTEVKRFFIRSEDLSTPFKFKINTGDLVFKIRIGVYFTRKKSGQHFHISLIDIFESEISNFITLPLLKELIAKDEKVEFLEKIRRLDSENLESILDTDLPSLKALLDKGSRKVFYLWALSDTIIKMTAKSKIPLSYLDDAVELFYHEYYDGKIALGFNP